MTLRMNWRKKADWWNKSSTAQPSKRRKPSSTLPSIIDGMKSTLSTNPGIQFISFQGPIRWQSLGWEQDTIDWSITCSRASKLETDPTVLVGQVAKMPSTFSKTAHSWKRLGESTGQNPGRWTRSSMAALSSWESLRSSSTPQTSPSNLPWRSKKKKKL